MEITLLIIGILIGLAIGFLLAQMRMNKAKQALEQNLLQKNSEVEVLSQKMYFIQEEAEKVKQELSGERGRNEQLTIRFSKAEAEYRALNERYQTYKQEFDETQKRMTVEFQNIANQILKEHSKEFTEHNQKNIHEIIAPFKEKIQSFEKKVDESHKETIIHNQTLKEEVKRLYELNSRISEEANNLTKALKGDNKKQGNWGEVVLERVLERSGLIKGQEYDNQYSTQNQDGEIIRPDVIIRLPENKHLIIDSKVSLIAYEAYVNTEEPEEKEKYLKLHIESLKNHIKGLSEKNYQTANGIDSPDFVLLFIPIEASFSIAVQQDVELFNFAWDRRIVIVSPSTLLAMLRTVASIWKSEKQNRNVQEIATEAGRLVDKFVGLLNDLEKLGTQLDTVQKTHQEAMKKISSGSGNIMGKIEKLNLLGAKSTKTLPKASDE